MSGFLPSSFSESEVEGEGLPGGVAVTRKAGHIPIGNLAAERILVKTEGGGHGLKRPRRERSASPTTSSFSRVGEVTGSPTRLNRTAAALAQVENRGIPNCCNNCYDYLGGTDCSEKEDESAIVNRLKSDGSFVLSCQLTDEANMGTAVLQATLTSPVGEPQPLDDIQNIPAINARLMGKLG